MGAYCGSVAKGRNEVEDGKAVADAVGSARTSLGTDRELATAQRKKAALGAAKYVEQNGQWTAYPPV